MPKTVTIVDRQVDDAPGSVPTLRETEKARPLAQSWQIIVIGASTGGPQALPVVPKGLASAIEHIPALIALHIPPEFTDVIAERIERFTGLPTRTARHGEEVRKGNIYISPGNLHLDVTRIGDSAAIMLSDGAPENFCKPSVDVLFRTAARAYGADVLGIVLTGMGSDGLLGSRAIVEAGGVVIAQHAASSAVWGMPRSVVNEGLAPAVLSIDLIGPTVCRLLRPLAFREKQS